MLNNLMLVGKIVEKPILEENENGKTIATITLAVPRAFKNSEGEHDTDYIPITLWSNIAENVNKYCEKGDVIGVKGRLQRLEGNSLQVVAEKITFLSSTAN